ncbi:uncharacterized protein A4U43_C07F26250 [Asparagus officinalis]|uniref:Leucine-rich repeat-containing N-terminal plant-type domain-containing protein n=1 Tax=Asparagus officinalis TaxID=4686 RepID=A0A5P1EEY5_ASPOF|nr:uncharacterized protein A4U43_C07F26250 [Asparagus officinalis]
MLSGTIPHQMSYLSSLQVLDLAQNNLSGRIPPSLKNFTAMANATKAMENTVIFDRSAVISKSADVSFPVVVKGRKEDYTTTLSLVVVFDLSCNRFSGEIPVETMDLVGLQSLNLSGNQLTGSIPNNVGRMAHLETLDLSSNHLIGAIPTGITLLSSLSSLNLSYNNLSGAIPSGKQLQTLTDTSIYAGNPDLCGSPLPVKCPADEPPQQSPRAGVETRIDDSDMFELYLGMGVGYVVGLWGTCALFLINKSWRIAYFCFFDDVADKLFAAKERLRRWMCPRLQG